jgi:hypothetical protein
MPKIARSFRLEDSTLKRLDSLVLHYQEVQEVRSPVKTKVNRTDILELLINQEFEKLIDDGYKL